MKEPDWHGGRYVRQPSGSRAFIPDDLPPTIPPVHLNSDIVVFLSRADQAIGRLDGVSQIVPNPDLFIAMYVRHEHAGAVRHEHRHQHFDMTGFDDGEIATIAAIAEKHRNDSLS